MRLVTWNINSVRLRQNLVIDLINEVKADVICLQETKTPDEHFPAQTFIDAGFEHLHYKGMKGYNGVAIISRRPFENPRIFERLGKNDCRHIAVSFPEFQLHNIYIPAGGDEPDRSINKKFAHKLDFIDDMRDFFATHYTCDTPMIAVGDFNTAPLENDVWSHKQLLKVISHTPIEVEKHNAMQSSIGWIDVARRFVPTEEKCYTWWSYRNRDWGKSNRGRRLDHVWITPPLESALKDHKILRHARDWEKPSDHVPVYVELDL
ncbi:MAG: exodeoxyribonuclease III [Alphaproteobacteria bacterium]|nr:exodeoxyribonuclease III [Alphaproteobacteria bacterium]